ncbi:MAG: alanine racemase [Lachnospiraceae bacterium]|nr:alanine racemase [Lachnospiraceae bacterium]
MSSRSYAEEMKAVIKGLDGIPTLLLHACCAPCSTVALEKLAPYFDITLFYYNPNIESEEEYLHRASELERLVREMDLPREVHTVIAPFESGSYREAVKGLEFEKEGGKRCEACFRLRLRETAAYASKHGFSFFSTTLTTGPMKNADLINSIGSSLESEFGVRFLQADLKKEGGFQRSLELSKKYRLYRQNYCGCMFSRDEVMKKRMIDELAKRERVFALIDTSKFRENVKYLIGELHPGSQAYLVLKANGYGHGAVDLMKAGEDIPGVYGAAVATIDEAIEMRSVTEKPILILAPIPEERVYEAVKNDVSLTVFTELQAEIVSEAAVKQRKTAKIHIKVDTGMNRIGLTPDEDGKSLIRTLKSFPGLAFDGIFTHLATMDEEDPKDALLQADRFYAFVRSLKEEGIVFSHVHIANSAASYRKGGFDFSDLSRLGISMYGVAPSGASAFRDLKILPVMSVYATVSHVKTIPEGSAVGYGGTFVAKAPTRVATVTAGYADGYFRSLSNRGEVVIRNTRCRILGRVCMDQFMVDVSGLKAVKPGDPVLLFGGEGENALPVSIVAEWAGTIPHEIMTNVSKRVKRIVI